MALYVVVNSDGTQQRVALSPLEQGSGNQLLIFNEMNEEPSADTHRWNPSLLAYELLPSAPEYEISRTVLSKREFLNRIGKPVVGMINARIITPPANAGEIALIAELMTMKDFLNAVSEVDLVHADTIAFADGLVALGYKTVPQRDTMLAPSTVASE